MKKRFSPTVILLGIIFILAFALRIYHLSFFEFKSDQLAAILRGNVTRKAHFFITHGLGSGVGINNPPLFLWFMGVITYFTDNPFYITSIFMLLNSVALLLAIYYFYISLPKVFAFFSSLLLAFSPAFTIYSSNIWAQSVLPLLMILFHIALYRFIKSNQTHYFIYLGILTALASQFHLSGFFLFPLLIILAICYGNKIKARIFAVTASLIMLFFLPYLYHLLYEKESAKFASYLSTHLLHKSFYWKLFREHLRIASFDFFRHYFRYDFNAVLDKSVGILKFALYPLSWILVGFFAFALIYYLSWLIKGRKLFNTNEDALKQWPLPFQIAGFMILFISLGYFVFRVRTPPHYFIILLPSYSLFMGFVAYKLFRFLLPRIVILLSIFSTIILLVSVLLFLKKAGGHPHEYGPSYHMLYSLRSQIQSILPEGYCPRLEISCGENEKCDKDAILAVVIGNYKCDNHKPQYPLKLNINWNRNLMHYEHAINIKK